MNNEELAKKYGGKKISAESFGGKKIVTPQKEMSALDSFKDISTRGQARTTKSLDLYKSGQQGIFDTGMQLLGSSVQSLGEGFAFPITEPLRQTGVFDSIGETLAPIAKPIVEKYNQIPFSPQQKQSFETSMGGLGGLLDIGVPVGGGALARKAGAEIADVAQAGIKTVGNALPAGTEVSAKILNRELKLPKITGANKFNQLAGETAGDYLTKKGIYGTQEEIMTKLADDWQKSYAAKKETLAQLPDQFTFQPVRTMLDDLVKYDTEISTPGAPSKFSSKIQDLYQKSKQRGLTLSEIDDVQYLHQNTTKLGYNKLINPKQVERATELDKAVRTFIDDNATKQGFSNFRELNKNTQLSRFLGDQIEKKLVGEESNNFFGLTDNIFLGASMFEPSALAGLATKKLLASDKVMGGVAKMFGGKGAPELKAEMSQSTPALLNPAGKPKTDFFVAPEGSKVGQFDPIGQTKLVSPQVKSQISYADTIPQKPSLVDDVVENSKRQLEEANKLLFPDTEFKKVNDNLKDELFGMSVVSKLDDTGKYAWETATKADDVTKFNQSFKSEIIDQSPKLKQFFENSKGDDFITTLSKEGIVPDITQNLKKDIISYPEETLGIIDKKIDELTQKIELPKKDVDVIQTAVNTIQKNPEVKENMVKLLDEDTYTVEQALDLLREVKKDASLTAFYANLKKDILASLERKQRANLDTLLNMERAKDFVELTNKTPVKVNKVSKLAETIEPKKGADTSNLEKGLEKLTDKQAERLFTLKTEEELVKLYEEYLKTKKFPKGVVGTIFKKMNK